MTELRVTGLLLGMLIGLGCTPFAALAQQISGLDVNSPVTENEHVHIAATVSGTPPLLATIDWGDGSPPGVVSFQSSPNALEESHVYLDDDPTGTPEDEYSIEVVLTHNGPGSDTETVLLTISNAAPQLSNIAITSPVNENEIVSLSGTIIDPGLLDTYTLIVDWGDGLSPETFIYAAGSTAFNETHRYLDDDPSGTAEDHYTIAVELIDDDTGTDFASIGIAVLNTSPQISNLSITTPIEAGESATLSGTFNDPGLLDSFELHINWGDGSPLEIFNYPAGSTAFLATHRYLTGGRRFVEVILRDDDTGEDIESIEINVEGPIPTTAVPIMSHLALFILLTVILVIGVIAGRIAASNGVRAG